ncbi:protein-export chaperone SecB [Helicobacter sp. 14348-15]|uniref:protein-export chaperone SecB n=1 Tax=Campylobacterales TaxID=213849 RepID=UPI000A35750D|nr:MULTISPECIES: protein-export chaperone SecB [Campylobacterales]MCL9821903.1 protein-export chaperone SecB [Helicobacter colisuis]
MEAQPNNSFKIKTIQIKKFDFCQTEKLIKNKQIKLEQTIKANAKKDDNQYAIQVNIKLLAKQDEKTLFYVKSIIIAIIEVEANFQEDYLNNMVAIIYSYLRPMVAQMTAMAKLPLLDLPPMNLENFRVTIERES